MDRYNSKIAEIVGRLNGTKPPDGFAVTISSSCTLYSLGKEAVDNDLPWRKHEDCHKKQIKDEGWFKFMVKYLFFSITRGYLQNPYEVEARLAAIL